MVEDPNASEFHKLRNFIESRAEYSLESSVRAAKTAVSKTVRSEVSGIFKWVSEQMARGQTSTPYWARPWSGRWVDLEPHTVRRKARRGKYGENSFFAYQGGLIAVLDGLEEAKVFNLPQISDLAGLKTDSDFTRKPYKNPILATAQTRFAKLDGNNYSFTVKVFPRLSDNPTENDIAKLVAAAVSDRRVFNKLVCSRKPQNQRPVLLPAILYFVKGRIRDRVREALRANGFQVS